METPSTGAADRPPDCSFRSPTPEATFAAARALGAILALAHERDGPGAAPDAVVLLLIGDLGAGKTLFAQGLGEGLGVGRAAVTSPTFTLAAEHATQSGLRLVHVDCYRLADSDELEALGVADWLEGGSVLAVEWGDRFASSFPSDRIELTLARGAEVGEDSAPAAPRELRASAGGPQSAQLLVRWQAALAEIPQLAHASGDGRARPRTEDGSEAPG